MSLIALLIYLVDGNSLVFINGCIFTADREYGHGSFTGLNYPYGLSSIYVMSSHILLIYFFVALSHLNPALNDKEDREGADNNKCGQTDASADGGQEKI